MCVILLLILIFQGLRDLDEEFRDNHIDLIKRFYLVFESIHAYITDLNQFLDDIDESLYIQQTLESIFMDAEGKQLMVTINITCIFIYKSPILVRSFIFVRFNVTYG